jgi:hypothetical protein
MNAHAIRVIGGLIGFICGVISMFLTDDNVGAIRGATIAITGMMLVTS